MDGIYYKVYFLLYFMNASHGTLNRHGEAMEIDSRIADSATTLLAQNLQVWDQEAGVLSKQRGFSGVPFCC